MSIELINKFLRIAHVSSGASETETAFARQKFWESLNQETGDVLLVSSEHPQAKAIFDLNDEIISLRKQIAILASMSARQQEELMALRRNAAVDTAGKRYVANIEATIERLTTELDNAQAEITRLKETVPTRKTKSKVGKRHSNFKELIGKLVIAARGGGGMKGQEVFDALNAFYRNFDGGELTENMIWGVAVTGDPDDVLPDGDSAPLTRREVIAMHTKLFGAENSSVRPMERFFITHIQTDIHNYMHDEDVLRAILVDARVKLRQRYWVEIDLRRRNPIYAKFSRGLALLEKRTKRISRHTEERLPTDEVLNLSNEWFGEDDAAKCIGQLVGYDHFTIEQTIDHGQHDVRKMPQELCDTVAIIRSLVQGLDTNHTDFETQLAAKVKQHNREIVKTTRVPETSV